MSNHRIGPSIRPDDAWLAAWRQDINAMRALVAGFEGRFGFAPGRNTIDSPDPADLAAAHHLAEHQEMAASLPHFYQHISAAVLEDIGNGYFIHAASHVLHDLAENGPITLGEPGPATLFASDGGGTLFAIATDGTIHRSNNADRDGDFRLVAEDLQDFLDQLRRIVNRFIETGESGTL
ncbi:hypothetical protein IU427_32680 [Nocardia beijingensis]|uniref:hypothetical protein n=1 Tax=Nocardia beijingensis TaxID=95162 RepID=UPI00189304FB|nr:hypothetical protein [Nocardia beijingensis]MBF6469882.1 hypothetical protein [Nocardia beijingensis]